MEEFNIKDSKWLLERRQSRLKFKHTEEGTEFRTPTFVKNNKKPPKIKLGLLSLSPSFAYFLLHL